MRPSRSSLRNTTSAIGWRHNVREFVLCWISAASKRRTKCCNIDRYWFCDDKFQLGKRPCVTTPFLLGLLLWTFEHYLILSYRYEDLLIFWSYLLILSWRSYLLIYDLILISWSYHLMMIRGTFLYMNFTLLLTCIQHAFDLCLSLMINMLLPYVWHALDIHFTCVYLEDNTWTLVYNRS